MYNNNLKKKGKIMKTEKEPRFINIKGIGEKLGLEDAEILELARAGILVVDNLECPKTISDISINKYLEKNLFPNPRRNDRWEDRIKSFIRFRGETEKLDCIIYGLYLSGKSILEIRDILDIRSRRTVEDALWRAQVRLIKAESHTRNLVKIKDLSERLERTSVHRDKIISYCDEITDKVDVIKSTVMDILKKYDFSGIQDFIGKYTNPRDLGDNLDLEDIRKIQEYLRLMYGYVWTDREEPGISPKYMFPAFEHGWAETIYTCPVKLWEEILEVSEDIRKLGITDSDVIETALELEETKPRSLKEFHYIYPERKDYNPLSDCHKKVLEYVMVKLGVWNRN